LVIGFVKFVGGSFDDFLFWLSRSISPGRFFSISGTGPVFDYSANLLHFFLFGQVFPAQQT